VKFELEPYHHNVSEEDLIKDINRVAKLLGKNSVTNYEYREYGNYGLTTVRRRFGSWSSAIKKANLIKTRHYNISDEELFENLEEIWIRLGRQPRCAELKKPLSKYSGSTYAYRFGTYRKALEAFITFVNKESKVSGSTSDKAPSEADVLQKGKVVRHKTSRKPNWRLRFLVMRRDNFRCQHCGRNPASEAGVRLHIDHIKPWSKG